MLSHLLGLTSPIKKWSDVALTVTLLFAVLVIIVIALRGPTWLKIFTVAYVFLP